MELSDSMPIGSAGLQRCEAVEDRPFGLVEFRKSWPIRTAGLLAISTFHECGLRCRLSDVYFLPS